MINCTTCKNYNPVNSETLLIKPTYNIGDEFWRMLGNKPRLLVIYKIRAEVTAENIKIYYSFQPKDAEYVGTLCLYDTEESTIKNNYFKTKQELIESL